MRGLKRVHRHLFGELYEWAGHARHEPVMVDGEVIELPPHQISKGAVAFGSSEESRVKLPRTLARHRDALLEFRDRGALTLVKWCEHTAEAVVAINDAHPFIEGNGRAMRHFIGCSAEYFGFVCKVGRRPEWMEACAEARRRRSSGSMVELLARRAFMGLEEEERERLRTAVPSELDDDDVRLGILAIDPPPSEKVAKANADVKRAEKGVTVLEIRHRARGKETHKAVEVMWADRAARPVRTRLADRGIMSGWLRERESRIRAARAAEDTAVAELGAARKAAHELRLSTIRRIRKEQEPARARVRALRDEWDRRLSRDRGHEHDYGMER